MIRTAAVLLVLAATPAAADPAPRVVPQHDATVTYTVSGAAAQSIPFLGGSDAPVPLRLQWGATSSKLMVTSPGRPQRLLVDLPGHTATVLDDSMHAGLALPMRDTDVQNLTMANARFTRRGAETVAGEPCIDWAVQSNRMTGTVCLTPDGIPVRGDGDVNGRHGVFVATSVDRTPVDPAALALPPGYNRIEMPAFGKR